MHNFPKDTYVVCNIKHNLKQAKEIFHLCIEHEVIPLKPCLKGPVDRAYPHFYVFNGELSLTMDNHSATRLMVSFEEFKAFICGKGKYKKPFSQSVKLNNTHTAIVTKKDIRVGCQRFTHEAIERLYRISLKAQKTV